MTRPRAHKNRLRTAALRRRLDAGETLSAEEVQHLKSENGKVLLELWDMMRAAMGDTWAGYYGPRPAHPGATIASILCSGIDSV